MNAPKQTVLAAVAAAVVVATLAGCGGDRGGTSDGGATGTRSGAEAWQPGDPTGGTTTEPTYTPPTGPAAPRPATLNPAAVDVRSPEAVSTAVVTTWFTWNTGTDGSAGEAVRRAAALLTPQLSAANAQARTPLTGPGAQWSSWAAQNAVITPQVGRPEAQGRRNTSTSAGFMHQVTLRPTTPEGRQIATPQVVIVATTLVNTADGWRVDDVAQL